MSKKSIVGMIVLILLSAVYGFIQNGKVKELEKLVGKAKIDTVFVKGDVTFDTVVVEKDIIKHDIDTLAITLPGDIVYKNVYYHDTVKIDSCAGTIHFSDKTNEFVDIDGKAHFPDGMTSIVYYPKFDIKSLQKQPKLFYGGGWAVKLGGFVYVSGNVGNVQLGVITGYKGAGVYIGKAF